MTVTVDRRASCNVVLGLLIFLFFLVLFCHLDTSMCMAARSRETRVGHVPYILTPPNAGAPLEKVLVWAMQFSHKGAVIEPRGPPKGGSVGRSLRETAGRLLGAGERFRLANGGLMQIVGFEGLAGCFAGPTVLIRFSASAKRSSASSWALYASSSASFTRLTAAMTWESIFGAASFFPSFAFCRACLTSPSCETS